MDENKIELTVELDTSKAEKQAEDLNDALVDGAKDANKEFKKYSNEVNKNLNKIKQQVDKTFNFSKIGNQLTSKLGNALGKIKNQINSVLGNIKANFNLNVKSSSSQQGSTGSSGANTMGASLITGGAMGAMLNKNQALNKVMEDTKVRMRDIIKEQKTSLQYTKDAVKENMAWNKTMDGIVSALETHTDGIDGISYNMVVELDKMSTVMKNFRKNVDVKKVLSENTMELREALRIANELTTALTVMNGVGNFDGKYADELARLDDLMYSLHQKARGLNFGSKLVPPNTLAELQSLVGITGKATSKFNIFKTQAVEAMVAIEQKHPMVGKAMNMIGNGVNKVVAKGKELKQAFKQGFAEPQQYLDNMKAKITEWANRHKQATDKVKSANKSVSGSFKSLLQQILPFASIYGIFNGLKSSITSYVNGLADSTRFATVFGNETQKMTEWLDDINSKVTTSKSELIDFSSTLYRMSKNMGIATDDALAMSKQMTELGADLVAFTNDANSIDALASALRGEYDSLQNYGYTLSASAVEARALAMGLDTASESALAFARQSLILEQSGDVLGYASRHAQTLSGQLAMLKKNFVGLGISIASCFSGLLQVVLPVLNSIVQAVTVAFNKLASVINSIFGLFGIKVGGASTGGGAIGSAIGGIADSLGGALDGAGSGAGDVADSLKDGAKSAQKISKAMMGIDQLHTIALPDADSGSSGGSGGGSGSGGSGIGSGVGGLDFGLSEAGASLVDSMARELSKLELAFMDVFNHIKQGFMVFKDEIIKQWSMLKYNIDKLGQAMADFFVSCWEHGLDKTAILIGGIVGSIAVTALNMANSVVEVVTGIFEHINPDNNEHTQKFIDALNELLLAVQGFIIDVGNWFQLFNEKAQPFYNNLADIGLIIATIAMQLGTDVINLIRDFMSSWAGEALIEGVCEALEWFSQLIEDALGFVRDNLSFFEALGIAILGAWGAFKLINGAIELWNGLGIIFANVGAICSGVATALSVAIGFLTSPIGLVVLAIGALIAIGVLLYKNWDTIKEKCKEVWEAVVQWFNEAGVDIEGILQYIWEKVSETFQRIWDTISTVMKAVWDVIKTIWNSIFNTVKDVITNIWEVIKSVFNLISSFIQLVLSIIVGLFTGEWDACYQMTSKFILAILDVIENIFTTIWDFIVDVFVGIKDTFVSAWNGMLDILTDTLDNMYQGVKDKFDAVVDFLFGIVDRIKGIFDFEWEIPKPKLPSIEWSMKDTGFMGLKVPSFSIKWMSEGGLVPTKTLLGVGDANNGKGSNMEAIVPLDMMWRKLDEKFDKQTRALANNNSRQPMNITLQLDSQVLGKATFDSLEELSRRGIIDLSDLV